jgi:hypothetical protein
VLDQLTQVASCPRYRYGAQIVAVWVHEIERPSGGGRSRGAGASADATPRSRRPARASMVADPQARERSSTTGCGKQSVQSEQSDTGCLVQMVLVRSDVCQLSSPDRSDRAYQACVAIPHFWRLGGCAFLAARRERTRGLQARASELMARWRMPTTIHEDDCSSALGRTDLQHFERRLICRAFDQPRSERHTLAVNAHRSGHPSLSPGLENPTR